MRMDPKKLLRWMGVGKGPASGQGAVVDGHLVVGFGGWEGVGPPGLGLGWRVKIGRAHV